MADPISLQSCPRVEGWPVVLDWSCTETLAGALTLPMYCVRPGAYPFRGGTVRVGWDGGHLLVWAVLEDEKVICAPDDGRPIFQLGDVFEIFMRDPEVSEYFELHFSPAGLSRAHRFGSNEEYRDIRRLGRPVTDFIFPNYPWDFLVRTGEGCWEVLARCQWPGRPSLGGGGALVSFSRYDYTDLNVEAVLSSTSQHPYPRFHRQTEWIPLSFNA